ncbi:MAG TPA: NAD-dependent epimerase/dehydratase family protein [Pyrinomonadaceae bacterium]|jgi:dihydroflavonol-4-reductase|nr:NAD-dependent epimerase/dehydratase family protein [Pyrinomonadaceae bacterium]
MATKKSTAKKAATKAPAKSKNVEGAAKAGALAKRKRPLTLVTGGTGFLGSHLVRLLVEEGVKPLRVLTTSAPSWLEELGVETFKGSITSSGDVSRAVEGVAEIYHLAGRVSRGPENAHEMYRLHVEGTRTLCEAARGAGVRALVMASTSGTIAVTDAGDVVPDEDWPTPLEIISRWPYYASKLYQERVALENFNGKDRRLVIINPSLLLGPGDERLSSTRVVLDFLARKIPTVPKGGLSFVDARDAARAFYSAMQQGAHGERYLLGAANWTFEKFFGRLERITKVPAPFVSLPSKLAVAGARGLSSLFRQWKLAPPVEPAEIEMAEYFWYLDASKAQAELDFVPRDTSETLLDTVNYVRENFLGGAAFRNAG